MERDSWKICSYITTVGLMLATVLCMVLGPCEGMIETAAGSTVHMKCYYSFVSVALVSGIGSMFMLCTMWTTDAVVRRVVSVAAVMFALACVGIFFPMIGVCAGEEMACVGHRTIIVVVIAIAAAAALVGCLKAGPKKNLPKAEL